MRGAKQDKDRSTILPERIKEKLRTHLTEVKRIHEEDIKTRYAEVYLPDALERKYPSFRLTREAERFAGTILAQVQFKKQ